MPISRENPDVQLERDQEQIANVDTAIGQSIDALRAGRNAVARGVCRQDGLGGVEASSPGGLIKAGRQRVIDHLADDEQGVEPGAETEAISTLTHQLSDCLLELASQVPNDRAGRLALEARLHAELMAYLSSIRKVLQPLQFERTSGNIQL